MTQIAFGRFTPYNTIVHRLDPRNKILMMVLLMVTIFLKVDSWSTTLIISGIYLIYLCFLFLIAKISFISLLKSLRAMLILILFLLIIYIFMPNTTYNPEHIAFYIGTFAVNYDAFVQAAYVILRIIMLLMVTMILTSTTSPMNLTYGLEWYMTPLKLFNRAIPHIIAMTMSIALRFIPTLIDETNRIIKAQASRGIDFEHGGLIKRFRAIISLIIPLFVSAINRSTDLSNAMEARGYDPYQIRSRYRTLKFAFRDLVALVSVLLIFGAALTLTIYDKYFSSVNFIEWIFNITLFFRL